MSFHVLSMLLLLSAVAVAVAIAMAVVVASPATAPARASMVPAVVVGVVAAARRGLARSVADPVVPVPCGGCGASGASPCEACIAALRRPPPLPPPPGVDAVVALLAYEGVARELVARVKYRNQRGAVPWLGRQLGAQVGDALRRAPPVDVVTWAPTTGRRRRRRGFDHAELLAGVVASELGLPCCRLLQRGHGPPQTGASRAERRRRPVLWVPRRAHRRVAGCRVLVVDDVCTSGSTLAVAARALCGAGAVSVTAAVAARTIGAGLPARPLKVASSGTDPSSR